MKNTLAVAFLFCLTSTIANAQTGQEFKQTTKPVICGPLQTIFENLSSEDIKENPVWIGKDQNSPSNYALFVNSKTGTFTIVQFNQEVGCVLGMGAGAKNIGSPL